METKFIQVGQKVKFIPECGKPLKDSPGIVGVFNGFQVIGGATILGFTYKDPQTHEDKPYWAFSTQLLGMEPVFDADSVTKGGTNNNGSGGSFNYSDPAVHSGTSTGQSLVAHGTSTSEVEVQPIPVIGALPIKRGRGRPKKGTSPMTMPLPHQATSTEPKRRGRPPKNPLQVQAVSLQPLVDGNGVPLPRKRGRPPKVPVAAPHLAANHVQPNLPPNLPNPTMVEEVDDIEENQEVLAPETTTPKTDPVVIVNDESKVNVTTTQLRGTDTSDPEVVIPSGTTRLTVPTRPLSSASRNTNRMPDEELGDY